MDQSNYISLIKRKTLIVIVLLAGIAWVIFFTLTDTWKKEEKKPTLGVSNPTTVDSTASDPYPLLNTSIPYNLLAPSRTFKLPDELEEVSGLSYLPDGTIAMIQDEAGIIYCFDRRQGKVVSQHLFEDKGDFEGIATIGNTAYVIESNGVLHEVVDFQQQRPLSRIFKTPLTAKNNVEGIAYLPQADQLILACKEDAGIYGEDYKDTKALYVFNLADKTLIKEPFLLVEHEAIQDFVKDQPKTEEREEWIDDFDPDDNDAFSPSGVAIHPTTNELYVIGTSGNKLLVIWDTDHHLKQVIPLRKKVFQQPEGICFDPDGTLYIANEGKDGSATLLQFEPN